MKIAFYSEFGELDLSNISFSTQENNPKLNEAMFTKFTLPFDVEVTHDFLQKFGDYLSYESSSLKNKIIGKLFIYDNTHDAELFIQSIEGTKLTCQLDYGMEELPNFDKKLSALPLENYKVEDIHTFAKDVCAKQYPATNFNFPRIYTEKYNPESDPWKSFDGYYNDLKTDGSEMRRNYIDVDGTPYNVNIIHPCPHLLYLLKTGFADAGYNLEGEILTDANLKDKWVFSGTEYFSTYLQRKFGITINSTEYYDTYIPYVLKYGKFEKSIVIPKPGKYSFFGSYKMIQAKKYKGWVQIFQNNQKIYEIISEQSVVDGFSFEINTTTENEEIRVNIGSLLPNMGDMYEVFTSTLVGDELDVVFDQNSDVITNINEINLKKAVPDITFGDLVKTIKNWFNYDVEVSGKTVTMNKIISDIGDVKDLQYLEAEKPKRSFLNKKSFLLKFLDLDKDYKKDNIFFDSNGVKLNGAENKETSIININGYFMPLKLPKPMGYKTAFVAKDSTDVLALVEYKGLENLQNNATYSTGCDFPELFYNNWEKWLKQRINGQEFNWKSFGNVEQVNQINIKDYIFCYNNVHVIKSITKEKITDTIMQIDITTETVG